MPSLKEIKGRINSISSTLAITSAMKMVASAKLQKAQMAIVNMLAYERRLYGMLIDLMRTYENMPATAAASGSVEGAAGASAGVPAGTSEAVSAVTSADSSLEPFAEREPAGAAKAKATDEVAYSLMTRRQVRRVAIVAFASNSSLCGAFNTNVIREAVAVVNEYRSAGLRDADIVVYSVGRKMADAMRKLGFPSPEDFTRMSDSPSYDAASALAQTLLDGFVSGTFDKVELVYNHYKSTSSQPTVRQTYLPLSLSAATADFQSVSSARMASPASSSASSSAEASAEVSTKASADASAETSADASAKTSAKALSETSADILADASDLIIEPSPEALVDSLLPKVIRLRIFTTLLDSAAAEHAARTVAMQLATDNGNDLLQELTLEYNKGRQQKITSEILDLVGGSLQ